MAHETSFYIFYFSSVFITSNLSNTFAYIFFTINHLSILLHFPKYLNYIYKILIAIYKKFTSNCINI